MVRYVRVAASALAAWTLVAAALPASARPVDDYEYEEPPEIVEAEDDAPAFNMFGLDMAIGALPVGGARTLAMSLGLGVEHPVFRKTRVFGEYDWLWLSRQDDSRMDAMTVRPERHANGHRAGVGLRRELIAKGRSSSRVFLDGELGASVTLANDNLAGVQVMPALFTGLRVGYDLYSRRDDSPSRTFETAMYLRAIAIGDGAGLTFGLGIYWGN